MTNPANFTCGDFVIYPGHGLGKITGIETRSLGDQELRLFVISFDRDRMVLRVPVNKTKTSGLRSLSSRNVMAQALKTLEGRASNKRSLWSRRALEYATKIKSGDPVLIAEVVRDLHRMPGQPERSYSERQIYDQARDRLTNEVAAVEGLQVEAATIKLDRILDAA